MWYVMQVTTGSERKIQLRCQRMIPKEFLMECFIPYYEEKKMFSRQMGSTKENHVSGIDIIPLNEKEFHFFRALEEMSM